MLFRCRNFEKALKNVGIFRRRIDVENTRWVSIVTSLLHDRNLISPISLSKNYSMDHYS